MQCEKCKCEPRQFGSRQGFDDRVRRVEIDWTHLLVLVVGVVAAVDLVCIGNVCNDRCPDRVLDDRPALTTER